MLSTKFIITSQKVKFAIKKTERVHIESNNKKQETFKRKKCKKNNI